MKKSEPISVFPKRNGFQYYKGSRMTMYLEVMERYDVLVFKLSKKFTPEMTEKLINNWKHKKVELV